MIDCIIKHLNLRLPSHLPTCQVFLQSHKHSLTCYYADLPVKSRSRVVLPAQGNGRRTEEKRPWPAWESMQGDGFSVGSGSVFICSALFQAEGDHLQSGGLRIG